MFSVCTGKTVDVIITSHARNHRPNQIYQVNIANTNP